MDKKQKSLIKSREKKNINIKINNNKELFPHKTKFNNLKTKKYFSINNINSDVMKKALIKYREDNLSNKSQNEVASSITSPSTCNISKINQNNNKNDKLPIYSNEIKTKTSFQKLEPKILELNQNENDDLELKLFNHKKNFNVKNIKNAEDTNHKKYISELKEHIKVGIDSILDDEDSIDFDINTEKNNEINYYKNNLTDRNKNNINININLHDINFIELIKIENLYNELIKDLEINKMNKFENKLNIINNFLNIFNDNKNQNLFLTIDMNSLATNSNIINKENNIFLMLKEYLIQQIIFFYIIILIGLIKNEQDKNIYLSGLENLSCYFHQNFQVFIFILTSKVNKNTINLLCDKDVANYEKCLNIVKENKIWLNENNYFKYLQINNKMAKQVINNLFEQIRIYFNSKLNLDNINNNKIKFENKNIKINKKINNKNKSKSLKKNKNKAVHKDNNFSTHNNNIQKDYINSDINLFLEYIKSFKKAKFTSLLKDLKYSPSINYLNDTLKLLDKDTNIKSIKNNSNTNNIDEIKAKVPFLKPINKKYKYTLVLDLDETLIHYKPVENVEYIQIRPGAEDFIKELSEFYEIIIFTASLKSYADLVIKGIDIDNKISGRLYREHTMKIGNSNIKDLDKLGRDLKKVIIIENSPENFNLQPKNGINVIDFDGNEYDDILYYLKNDLIKLVKLEPDDVRNYLKEIQINMNKRANELINMCRNINCSNKTNEHTFKNKNNKKTIINNKILEKINEYEFENTMSKEKIKKIINNK